MKQNVKNLVITAVFILFSISVNAQLRWGLRGGLNLSTMSGWEDINEARVNVEISGSPGYVAGSHLGLISQYDLSTEFFLQAELLFSTQGLKVEASDSGTGMGRLNFIQLPVYAGCNINIVSDLNFIVAAGPFLAFGIYGSDDAYETLQRFDAGASFMGGLQFRKTQLTVGYDLGLVDQMDANGWKTAKDIFGLSSIQNKNIKISVASFF
jgi:hypothetical protein